MQIVESELVHSGDVRTGLGLPARYHHNHHHLPMALSYNQQMAMRPNHYGYHHHHHNLPTQFLPYTGGGHQEGAHPVFPVSQFGQHPREHFTLVSNLYGPQWNSGGLMSNILSTAPPICQSSQMEGPFRQIPVIQGIPRQRSCNNQVISENSTTNNQLLVCLTPNMAVKNKQSGIQDNLGLCLSNSNENRSRCRVDITTLPGWTMGSATKSAKGSSSKKKTNLKKRWTKRYQESKPRVDNNDDTDDLESVDRMVILQELETLRMAHDRLEQQVSLQKRRQKKLRRDIDLIGELLPTEISAEIIQNCEY